MIPGVPEAPALRDPPVRSDPLKQSRLHLVPWQIETPIKVFPPQLQSINTNASNKKLRQAKQAIDNSIGIMYATKNPSFENQLLVSYFKKASKEIDLALKY